MEEKGVDCSKAKAIAICRLLKERITFPQEFWTNGQYFFYPPQEYDQKIIKKKWNDEAKLILGDYKESLKSIDTLTKESALVTLNIVLEKHGIGLGKVMQALRVIITGVAGGPDLMGIMEVLGKDEIINRIEQALINI